MARASSNIKKLQQRSVATRRGLEGLVQDVEEMCSSPSSDAVSASGALEGELRAWTGTLTPLRERLETLSRQLDARRNEQVETLEQRVARELGATGCSVFGQTSLLIVEGIVHLEMDLKKRRVVVNGITLDDLAVPAICQRVTEELARLRASITPPLAMLKQVAEAYDREARLGGVELGTQVHTTALLLQIALARQTANFRSDPSSRNFREYSLVQVRADLYTLLQSGEQSMQRRRFRYASGADTTGAVFMLVPALQRTAHIGRVWFEGEGATQR